MKTSVKTIVLISGLLGAGALLAYGPGMGGVGFPGYGPGHHRMMTGYGPGVGPWSTGSVDTTAYLQQTRDRLGITAEQEQAWNAYAQAIHDQRAVMDTLHNQPFTHGPFARDGRDLRATMWEQRTTLNEAAQSLFAVLTPAQRSGAAWLLGHGPGINR